MTEYLGGCSCGKIRYELLAEPMFTHCCHCHLCQQITGSAFITNTFIEGTNFKLTIHEPLVFSNNESIETITLNLNSQLEKLILKNPGQWIWSHNRWK